MAHDGPDPLASWVFSETQVSSTSSTKGEVRAKLGPTAKIQGEHQLLKTDTFTGLFLSGRNSGIVVAEDFQQKKQYLPTTALTISTWISVDEPQRWGGITGVVQDNGDDESGWVLGYDETTFTFALRGANGNGRLTYLKGKTPYERGKLYHVVAIYDGSKMQLFVNGKLDASSTEQSGKIVYPESSAWVIAAYSDSNEFHSLRGRIAELSIYNLAAKPAWVTHDFEHQSKLAALPVVKIQDPLRFDILPYLQFGTQTSMTVMWRTNHPTRAKLHYGETAQCDQSIEVNDAKSIHEIKITGLEPETQYFYRTESFIQASKDSLMSEVSTFQTAVKQETPFAFAVISDTQGNPAVAGKIAEFAWGTASEFLNSPGRFSFDRSQSSTLDAAFFPSMNRLIRHVPFYPVLGNHEQNADHYFNYVSLPTPEYYYQFKFGNAHFFMIDSNRNIQPGSEQYQWLDQALQQSNATWKIVSHHHPPYSSDENDYGNLWKTNQGTRGDLRARKLVPLYEKHKVDLVWNGHIHSYERTWPLKENRAVTKNGPIYMITGGGGGGLEDPGPVRPFFQNTVRRGHHYCMVRINGTTLEMQAYDLENRLFDQLVIKKK